MSRSLPSRPGATPRGSDVGLAFDLGWVLWASDWSLLAEFGHWFLPVAHPHHSSQCPDRRRHRGRSRTDRDRGHLCHPPRLAFRAHAAWALRRLGGSMAAEVLRQRLGDEEDPIVRQELAAVPIGK